MIANLSPQVRLLALVGVLAAAALVASTQLVLRGDILTGDADPAAVSANVSRPAGNAPAPSKAKTAAKADAPKTAKAGTEKAAAKADTAKAETNAKPATATDTKPVVKRPLRTHGLPVPVARALQRHRVVVVSLFAPNAAVDRLSKAEAEAGAEAAGVGFVALDVLERENAEPLGTKLGVIKAPSVLVYTRPAELFVELDGFADMATVAQAADNARR